MRAWMFVLALVLAGCRDAPKDDGVPTTVVDEATQQLMTELNDLQRELGALDVEISKGMALIDQAIEPEQVDHARDRVTTARARRDQVVDRMNAVRAKILKR